MNSDEIDTNIDSIKFVTHDFILNVSGDGSSATNVLDDVPGFVVLVMRVCAMNEYMLATEYGGALLGLFTLKEEHRLVKLRTDECLKQLRQNNVWLLKHKTIDNAYVMLRGKITCVPDWKFSSLVSYRCMPAGSTFPWGFIWIFDSDKLTLQQPREQLTDNLLNYEYKGQPSDKFDTWNEWENEDTENRFWGFVNEEIGSFLLFFEFFFASFLSV